MRPIDGLFKPTTEVIETDLIRVPVSPMEPPIGSVDIPPIPTDIASGKRKLVCNLGKLRTRPCSAGRPERNRSPTEPLDALVTHSNLIRYLDFVVTSK